MALKVVEQWSAFTLSKAPPWAAHKEWIVTGTTNVDTALAAVDATNPAIKIPQTNDALTTGSRLVCPGPKVIGRIGMDGWRIGTDFGITDIGQFNDTNNDPLIEKATYEWRQVDLSEQVDLDLDQRPLVYSNGEPIQGINGDFSYDELEVEKNFPFYNVDWEKTYRNATNKTAVTLFGTIIVLPHQLRIRHIAPVGKINIGGRYIRVGISLEIVLDGALGKYPFQHRVMDQGSEGFSSTSATRTAFIDTTNQRVTKPYKLDGNGKPMALDGGNLLKVAGATPVDSPNPWIVATNADGTNNAIFDRLTTSLATIGWFKKSRIVDVNPFLALFN